MNEAAVSMMILMLLLSAMEGCDCALKQQAAVGTPVWTSTVDARAKRQWQMSHTWL